jgi:hypothetical protein
VVTLGTKPSAAPACCRLSATSVAAHKKEFTEPVALSSTQPDDLPLPRTTFGLSFDLLALRARCVEEARACRRPGQGGYTVRSRNLRRSSLRRRTDSCCRGVGGGGIDHA